MLPCVGFESHTWSNSGTYASQIQTRQIIPTRNICGMKGEGIVDHNIVIRWVT